MPFALARAAALVGIAVGAAACSARATSLTLLTINIANGAGDVWRSAEVRARQAAFVAAQHANLVGMEEIDVDVERSFHADTGADVLALACTVTTPAYTADGVRRCSAPDGTYLFGRAITGADTYALEDGLPAGIPDHDDTVPPAGTDRSPDAAYGVALGARGLDVSDAYTVGLPTQADQPPDDPLFTELATSGPDSPARLELAARNLALRMLPALEPRTALVTRLGRLDAPPLSVVVTHLEIAAFADINANQLARVVAVARAERIGPPARNVIVMGDFNEGTFGHADALGNIGLRRALEPPSSSLGDRLDQIWVDADLLILDTEQVSTMGLSDHAVAVRATIR
jgi:endonuclease/exonuclease/phosphatase family metal-dependent hydrolase